MDEISIIVQNRLQGSSSKTSLPIVHKIIALAYIHYRPKNVAEPDDPLGPEPLIVARRRLQEVLLLYRQVHARAPTYITRLT